MVLYFSGTGNSRAVATMLAPALGDPAPVRMTPGLRTGGSVDVSQDGHVVWVFPVYSWGVPPYVLDVMQGVNLTGASDNTLHHAVMTCGDDCGRADRMWRAKAHGRKWATGAVATVQMPNNYVAMRGFDTDAPEVEATKLMAMPSRVGDVARMIRTCDRQRAQATDVVPGAAPCIKTACIYPWFIRHMMNPAGFSVDTSCCDGCGKCQRRCPLGNIRLTPLPGGDSHHRAPVWGSDCAGCLACYHICPRHAVGFRRRTSGKGQYICNVDTAAPTP